MEELLKNIMLFWNSAELVYKTKDYTSATILYFKCFFVLLDFIIFRAKKMTPKDHADRFRILQESFPVYYTALDKLFQVYRNTYSLKIEKEKCGEVRKYVKRIAEEQGVQLGNK